nr:protein SIEVE ELEMENT OCCLUSION C-like [Coffea arabica]
MSLTGFERRYIHLPVSTEEDFLIRKILMTHDPDGRQLDAQQLLHAVKNIIHRASPVSEADCHPENVAVWDADAIGLHDSLGYTIFKISHEVLSRCFEGGDIHTKTMSLFDMLGKFRWDAKVVLVVAAFFTNYGVLQLQVQLQSHLRTRKQDQVHVLSLQLPLFYCSFPHVNDYMEFKFYNNCSMDYAQFSLQIERIVLRLEREQVVILLISKPELLPIEKIFLLVHQTYDHPHQEKIGGSYVVLWVPLSSSHGWSHADKISFQFLSGSLPFWSLKQPGLLNSAVVNFIIQEWNFKEEATMVVLDTNGMITNSNAMDMIWIWGAKAFPFSISREKELWEVEKWTLQLMIDGIDPLLTKWQIEEGKNFCIFGSGNADWIRNFSSKIKEVSNTELQLEVIYVGWRSPTEKLQSILRIIEQENLCTYLTFTKIRFFWLRLESMKSLTSRQENNDDDDMSKEILGLLEVDDSDDGWVLIGTGSLPGLIKLQGQKVTEFFDLFPSGLKI